MDLSFLESPEILEVVFPLVYSPLYSLTDLQFSSPELPTYSVEVEEGIKINCGFWVNSKEYPSMLYFHGNGETVGNHDWVAPFYKQKGINLFVAEYRGYGSSNGKPTIANMLGDAHTIFKNFTKIIREEGFRQSLFLMGRSLGSMPAIELAFNYQDEIRGLIIESGTANNFRRLWSYMEIAEKEAVMGEDSLFLNKVKIRQIHKPTLIIHGEYDQIIPVEEGEELYQNSVAPEKRILVIPGADHNDIILVKQELYFDTIEDFTKTSG